MPHIPDIDGENVIAVGNDTVRVKDEHFRQAVPGDQFNCALVWAIRDKMPDALRVRVNTEEVAYTRGGVRYHYPTDDAIKEKVIEPLDTGAPVESVTIRLHDGYAVLTSAYTDAEQRRSRDNHRKKRAENGRGNPQMQRGYRRMRIVNGDS